MAMTTDNPTLGEALERLRIMAQQRKSTEMYEQERDDDFQGAYDWFCDEARAILAALGERQGWQPIETARREHGHMILSLNRHGAIDTICWNESEQGWDDGLGYREGDETSISLPKRS